MLPACLPHDRLPVVQKAPCSMPLMFDDAQRRGRAILVAHGKLILQTASRSQNWIKRFSDFFYFSGNNCMLRSSRHP